MTSLRVLLLTVVAMIAFAANSVLCRLALKETAIDPASFTAIRIASGALILWVIVRLRARKEGGSGNWTSGLALFAYAATFSYAYANLSAATGALLLFGAVQVTMFAVGLWRGERLALPQWMGFALALGGLVGLLLPGLQAPPMQAALLMLAAGCAWGVYSLRAKGAGDPTVVTSGNFMRALPPALALYLAVAAPWTGNIGPLDGVGVMYALLSGALASGLGYVIWYAALPGLRASTAATVQLSVPLLTAVAGMALLAEPLTPRLVLAGAAILGGIALVIRKPKA